jgi:uncharacterized membrane protein YqhA
VARLWLFG